MANIDQSSIDTQTASAEERADEVTQAGTAEFKTVKAGCGIRFDPDSLDEEAGFDFSGVESLKPDLTDAEHSPDENSET